jgi:hypothetical protein
MEGLEYNRGWNQDLILELDRRTKYQVLFDCFGNLP